jgi:hypothetical protein
MAYTQIGNLVPQQEMGGFWDNLWSELKSFGQAGLQAKYGQGQGGGQGGQAPPPAAPQPGFFDIYGKYVIVGGVALGALLLWRKSKR